MEVLAETEFDMSIYIGKGRTVDSIKLNNTVFFIDFEISVELTG